MHARRPAVVPSLVALLAFQPALALADGKVMTATDIQFTGAPGPSTIAGSAGPDVIFGDPAASDGPPVKMERITEVKMPDGTVVEADGESDFYPHGGFSPDGRSILVASYATNLVPGKNPTAEGQVFMRDIFSGAWSLVSADELGKAGSGTSEGSFHPTFSPDGSHVVFASDAKSLTGALNFNIQIVAKNLVDGGLTVLSRSSYDGGLGDGDSYFPVFSADGSRLAFSGEATNLVPGDVNAKDDVFLVDIDDYANDHLSMALISAGTNGEQGVETASNKYADSYSPTFAPDGKSVAFESNSGTIFDGDGNDLDIFVKTLGPIDKMSGRMSGALDLVSVDGDGNQVDGSDSHSPAFSPNGADLFFATRKGLAAVDTNDKYDIVAHSMRDMPPYNVGDVRLISLALANGAPILGDDGSYDPIPSPDGKRVVFGSQAKNLVEDVGLGTSYIAIKDLSTESIHSVSRGLDGMTSGLSYSPGYSPDGRRIAFRSFATSLVPNDTNGSTDVFLATLPAGPVGNDTLSGGGGDDRIFGGGGDDLVDGGTGSDWLFGGPGNDTFVVDAAGDHVVEYPGEGRDTVRAALAYTLPEDVEDLVLTGAARNGIGNALGNRITGTGGNDTLSGLGGNDRLSGGGGKDRLLGGDGNDVLAGGGGGDRLDGGAGNDRLEGGGGNDRLLGGPGNDRLTGGKGRDVLKGGPGNDVFAYTKTNESRPGRKRRDTIVDLDKGDRIDLSKLDANSRKKRRQHFRFIGARPFAGKPAQLRFAKGLLQADVNGDGKADFEIKVKMAKGKFGKKRLKLK